MVATTREKTVQGNSYGYPLKNGAFARKLLTTCEKKIMIVLYRKHINEESPSLRPRRQGLNSKG